MAKAKQRFSWAYNHEDSTATVVDNQTEETEVYDFSSLPTMIQQRVQVYGLGKVLQDRNSQVSADGKLAGMTVTFKSLADGQWKAERSFGSRLLPAYIEAIVDAKGCSPAAAQKAYRALDDESKSALRLNLSDQIKAIEKARESAEEVELDDLTS